MECLRICGVKWGDQYESVNERFYSRQSKSEKADQVVLK